MKDKFKMNFLIVLPAAIITVVFFWFVTRNVAYDITENLDYNFWQVVPYLVVLIGALIGINVFLVLIGGTVISLIAGVATGNIVLADMFTVVGDGVVSMYCIACEDERRNPVYSGSDQKQDSRSKRSTGRNCAAFVFS